MLRKHATPEHADSAPAVPDYPATMDDVFGADEDGPLAHDQTQTQTQTDTQTHAHAHEDHPSDVRRLQQEHATAGYRDGITAAKAASIQAGFDEGFGLGATMGLAVGRLLGLLEGIVAAAAAVAADDPDKAALSAVLADARAELAVQSVLGEAYWHADGTWKYDVAAEQPPAGDGPATDDLLFAHIAEAHPLVQKWTARVAAEMRRWGLQEPVPCLARRGDDDNDDDPAAGAQGGEETRANGPSVVLARAKATGPSQGEAKAPSDALSW